MNVWMYVYAYMYACLCIYEAVLDLARSELAVLTVYMYV